MALNATQILVVASPSVASTNGTASAFQGGRAVQQVRWWLTGASASAITHYLDVSPDGTTWAEAANVVNIGSATQTGTFNGPVAQVRVRTGSGATPGTATARFAAILMP